MNINITRIGAVCAEHSAVTRLAAVLILASGLAAASAQAQSQSDVAVALVAQRVVVQDGKERLIAAERATPGDIVQYDARYHNQSRRTVSQLAPSLPIPAGMVLVPGSARPAPAQASLDGRTFSPLPLKRKLIRPDGTMVEEEIPATEFRALRWQVGDLAAGARTNVTARVRLAQR